MTVTQQARLAGIRAHLAVRGRMLTHVASGASFAALAEHAPGFKAAPDSEGSHAFAPEERSVDSFYALRVDLAETVIAVGDELAGAAGISYRVVAVEDSPNDLLVRFTVEVSR